MSKKKALVLAAGLILMAALSSPMAALAATTGDTTVTGSMSDTIAVAAPANFAMPALDPSASPIISTGHNVVVSANGSLTWGIYARGDAAGAGKMHSAGTPTDMLASAMVLNAPDDGAADKTLTGINQLIVTGHVAGSDTVPVTFKQTVAYTDPVHTDYTMTVTFTVAFSV